MAAVAVPDTLLGQEPTDRRTARRTPVVDVFEKSRDAVVNIRTTQVVQRRVRLSPFDDLFEDFFMGRPRGPVRQFETTSLGSGFVIHPAGYVVTNAHVVARSTTHKIIFADEREFEAERVAMDERHDLAILRIQGEGSFPTLDLGRSDDLMIGETVIAIGNPLGYHHTVTSGIVSATDRTLQVSGDVAYDNLIQTDASINRGNSGGPLLNVLGELIGINTAIRGDAQNIGFAIPVDTLRKLLPEMLSLKLSEKRLEVGLRLSWRAPVYVVESRGPAAEAGIEPGDELLSVDGVPVVQNFDFYIHLLGINEADPVRVEVERDGRRIRATIQPRHVPIPDGAELLVDRFGLHTRLLTQEEARSLRIPGGLLITDVERGSPADEGGFQRGHVIVQIDRFFPTSFDQVGLLLEHVARGERVRFGVYQISRTVIELLHGELRGR